MADLLKRLMETDAYTAPANARAYMAEAADCIEDLTAELAGVRVLYDEVLADLEFETLLLEFASMEKDALRMASIKAASALAAAISLLEKGGKAAKKAAASDTMFDIMIDDYYKSLHDVRAAIERAASQKNR